MLIWLERCSICAIQGAVYLTNVVNKLNDGILWL